MVVLLSTLALLSRDYPDGATYRGLRARLGYTGKSALRENVRQAEELGLVERKYTGRGPRAVVVVALTPVGAALMQRARKHRHGEKET